MIYYFIFENEYMNEIIAKLCGIFHISQKNNSKIYKDEMEQVYVLDATDEGVACVYANEKSYVYEMCIICAPIYQCEIEELLRELCNEIEEDYGDDRTRFISGIDSKSDIMMNCYKTAERFGYMDLIERMVGVEDGK